MQLYVCVNCGKLGEMHEFNEDECRPGWTHGVKVKVDLDRSPVLRSALSPESNPEGQ